MSNRRRLRGVVHSQRAAVVAETVITAGMISAWQQDPTAVPPEWREFWDQHGPRPVHLVDGPTREVRDPMTGETVQVPAGDEVRDPTSGEVIREATALDGLAAAVEQQARADQNVAAMVTRARTEGRSWSAIGEILGMTKQSAGKRYGP